MAEVARAVGAVFPLAHPPRSVGGHEQRPVKQQEKGEYDEEKAEEEDVPVDAEGSVQKGEEFHNAFKEFMEENEEEEGEMEPEKSVAAIMVDQIREEERASGVLVDK